MEMSMSNDIRTALTLRIDLLMTCCFRLCVSVSTVKVIAINFSVLLWKSHSGIGASRSASRYQ